MKRSTLHYGRKQAVVAKKSYIYIEKKKEGEGRGVRFPEKVTSQYIQKTELQTDIQTESIVEELRS